MKANTCGTMNEQIRVRIGWKSLTDRKACGADLGKCCSNCKYFMSEMYTTGDESRNVRFRCMLPEAGFSTRASAGCNKFERR